MISPQKTLGTIGLLGTILIAAWFFVNAAGQEFTTVQTPEMVFDAAKVSARQLGFASQNESPTVRTSSHIAENPAQISTAEYDSEIETGEVMYDPMVQPAGYASPQGFGFPANAPTLGGNNKTRGQQTQQGQRYPAVQGSTPVTQQPLAQQPLAQQPSTQQSIAQQQQPNPRPSNWNQPTPIQQTAQPQQRIPARQPGTRQVQQDFSSLPPSQIQRNDTGPTGQRGQQNSHLGSSRMPSPELLQQPLAGLSDADLKVMESLPPACTAELPGLDFRGEQAPTDQATEEESIRVASLANMINSSNENKEVLASHASGYPLGNAEVPDSIRQQMNEAQSIRTAALPGGMPNPHSGVTDLASAMKSDDPNAPDPHLDIYSRDAFPSAMECAACHQQIFDEWAASSHAYASISPMFHVFENTINRLAQGTVGYFCLRCHAPVATTMGLRRDQAIWDGPRVFREGVTCVACHRVKTPYGKVNGERRMEPGPVTDPIYGAGTGAGVDVANKYSQFFKVKTNAKDKKPGQLIHRRAIEFEELNKSVFCMSCHQVAVQPGIKLEVVWDQYRASPAYREGVTCQDCHMGHTPGVDNGYSVGPAAVVNEKVVNPERRHSNHMFYGPGYSIAHPGIYPQNKDADRWSVNDWLAFDWRAGWGTDEFEDALADGNFQAYFPPVWEEVDDRYDAREVLDANIKKLEYKKDIRRQVMENGSKLDGPFFNGTPRVGKPLKFHYCVTNLNSGHNMPSGSLGAQPQLWMNAVLIGPNGNRIWETGNLDSNGDLRDLHSLDVLARRVPHDDQLFNLQTKFLTTNVKGTDREMYLPVNVDFDQLPFLRPAAQPVTVINHPPFIRMEGHSIPPLGSKKAKFAVPSHLIQQPGTYRLSVRMRSRAEPIYFMRFCDATPEMERMMNEWIADFHVSSAVFEVR